MGIWNETCVLSNLFINPGDRVRYWLITKNPCYNYAAAGNCYPNDIWFPRTCALEGVYDDYGRIMYTGPQEIIKFILKEFDDLIELEQSSYEQATHKGMTFLELQDWMHDSIVIVNGGKKWQSDEILELPVGYCMAHEEVYHDLLASAGRNNPRPQDLMTKHLQELDGHLRRDADSIILGVVAEGLPDQKTARRQWLKLGEELVRAGNAVDSKIVKRVIQDLDDQCAFDGMMTAMRFSWHPSFSKTQYNEVDLVRVWIKSISKYLDKYEQKLAEE